ncbi:hypothetical protein PanWU01x14_363870 [Parasponia andersonii]|uniref:Uncharacterized protein n=1 Tax=Parasponia andersonii TaxID=3476 RepID=A0A2P5A6H7_PARAD|nr:hypothetical protein PanWU01x14_363870 [Parasponia andersonii]
MSTVLASWVLQCGAACPTISESPCRQFGCPSRFGRRHIGVLSSVALRAPPSVKVRKLAQGLVTSDYLPIWQEIPITELFFPEVTIFLLGIVCSPPLPSSSGGVQYDLGNQEE